tara:strand:+ start:302 stop:1150 length:849 start_codon:yes stop_codon:yes gene_type:complete
MIKKSVISLVSYDANRFLAKSIERYYEYVDEIVLGIDKDRVTWSGNPFEIDEEALWNELSNIDGDSKITIIEEDFHQSKVAIENDNYERNFLKGECSNDWVFSFDADEMLINAKDFFYNFCPLVEDYRHEKDLCMWWTTPYKVVSDEEGEITLMIAEEDGSPFFKENQGFATSKDSTFTYARWTDKSSSGDNRLFTPLVALHWSLCRPENELHQKIHNIGHSDIVEEDPFYKIWSQVDINNYNQLRNFKTSGLGGAQWPKLEPVPSENVEDYIKQNLGRAYE